MRRLPGDPCNPNQAQECYYGQHACVGFTCLGWLENGTCTAERDCIGGMFSTFSFTPYHLVMLLANHPTTYLTHMISKTLSK
jgi:hypothetical protein